LSNLPGNASMRTVACNIYLAVDGYNSD